MVYLRLVCCVATSIALCGKSAFASTQPQEKVIKRDVAIIGGGSSGTYTAVRLRDFNKSVIVLEKQDKLGGHADTYIAPNGYALNMGVVVFDNTTIVRDYFKRFNVPLVLANFGDATTKYVNLQTGKPVNFTAPSDAEVAVAFEKYAAQLLKYPELQVGFNLTYPVAPDLLLPFGEFLKKYGATALLQTAFAVNQGDAPLLSISTLYMLKSLNALELQSLEKGFLTTKHHDTQTLYNKARKALGDDALLNADISHISRPGKGLNTIKLTTPSGPVTVQAKKIVFALQPHDINFSGLTAAEQTLFAQFFANGYYSAVIADTGLPSDVIFDNAAPGKPYGIPSGPDGSPHAYSILTNAPTNLTQIYYGLTTPKPAAEVKQHVLDIVRRVQQDNGYKVTDAKIVAFSDHSPYNSQVSNAAIEDRFYEKLGALQGTHDTFYNGAAFHVQDSSLLWQFSEDYIVPLIVGSLNG